MDPNNSLGINLNNLPLDNAIKNADQVGTMNDGSFARFITWLREPSKTGWDLAGKIALYTITALTALTGIGLLIVIPVMCFGALEWSRQIKRIQLNQVEIPVVKNEIKQKINEPSKKTREKSKAKTSTTNLPKAPITQASTISQKEQSNAKVSASIESNAASISNQEKQSDLERTDETNQTLSMLSVAPIFEDEYELKSSSEESGESKPVISTIEKSPEDDKKIEITAGTVVKVSEVLLSELLKTNECSFFLPIYQLFNPKIEWNLADRKPLATTLAHQKTFRIESVMPDVKDEKIEKASEELHLERSDSTQDIHDRENVSSNEESLVEELFDDDDEITNLREKNDFEGQDVRNIHFVGESLNENIASAALTLVIPISQEVSYLFSEKDRVSLSNLGQIKANQVIDVYEDGTVSEPYDDVENGYIWGTGLWFLGYGTNSDDDLTKIKSLMLRVLYAYHAGYKPVKGQLEEALEGLNTLKDHYALKKNFYFRHYSRYH